MRTRLALLFSVTLFGGASAGLGCGSGGSDDGVMEIDNGFESDDPTGRTASETDDANESSGADAGASSSADASAPAPGSKGGSEAERAVEEADIIKQEGNKLYALSRYGGLAILDVTDPDHMKMLGRKRTDGIPFEMYVRNGRAYVMMNEFGHYVRNGAAGSYGQWVQSSEILAYDVQNPAAIAELTHFDVPGTISDSRIVGDALYLVTNESGYCWNCGQNPATIVTSFNVTGTAIAKVDQIKYTSPNNTYSAWKRSVTATNERLYIAGPEWTWTQGSTTANSIIQVVDITDPGGHMVKGADVPVAGQINSRWQMDEFNGVLRVVSQYGNGRMGPNGTSNPQVQTFTVASASSITPLGQTQLVLPMPETLQSVRFDGPRAYAITSRRTDPLFTIDLANAAAPKQTGELEMPGWVFHMEPRGDRLVGFGWDDTTASSRLAVSLFDVSDMTKPTMLKRVSFGSTGGSFAEDQDRIHKSVSILDDQGLILVPFASYGRWSNGNCGKPQSGIQLIDFSRNDLTLRGIAPQYGMPRRAFMANDRLLAVSDRNVTSFDIAARDVPVKKGELDLSNPAYRMVEVGSQVASITNDWWTGEVLLSLTPKANADDAAVSGKLSLASLATLTQTMCSSGSSGWASWYQARLFANGNFVYVTVPIYTYNYSSAGSTGGGKLIVAAVDVTNPAKPVLAGQSEVLFTERTNSRYGYGYGFYDGYSYYSYYGSSSGSLVGSGQGIVQLGSKLAYLEVDQESIEVTQTSGRKTYETKLRRKLHVVDFATPAAPVVHKGIDLGESLGASPLHLVDGKVLTSRWIPSNWNREKVRFFVDRVDLTGAAPLRLPSINTPGSLLLADEATSRLVTTDYTTTRSTVKDYKECQDTQGWRAQFNYATKACVVVDRSFKLSDLMGTRVSLRQTFVPPSQNIAGVQIADDRIYVTRYRRYDYNTPRSGNDPYPLLDSGGLWAIGGIRAGNLSIVSQMSGDAEWPLAAHGTKVAIYTQGGMAIYDTKTPVATLVTEANLRGWGYSSHVLLSEDRAICSLGEWGLQTIKY